MTNVILIICSVHGRNKWCKKGHRSQGSKGIRQRPINWCTYILNDDAQNSLFCRIQNQSKLLKVPKVVLDSSFNKILVVFLYIRLFCREGGRFYCKLYLYPKFYNKVIKFFTSKTLSTCSQLWVMFSLFWKIRATRSSFKRTAQ